MKLKSIVLKTFPILFAVSFAGGAIASGGSDTPGADKPKVDCQKMPTHPDCKGKAN